MSSAVLVFVGMGCQVSFNDKKRIFSVSLACTGIVCKGNDVRQLQHVLGRFYMYMCIFTRMQQPV